MSVCNLIEPENPFDRVYFRPPLCGDYDKEISFCNEACDGNREEICIVDNISYKEWHTTTPYQYANVVKGLYSMEVLLPDLVCEERFYIDLDLPFSECDEIEVCTMVIHKVKSVKMIDKGVYRHEIERIDGCPIEVDLDKDDVYFICQRVMKKNY